MALKVLNVQYYVMRGGVCSDPDSFDVLARFQRLTVFEVRHLVHRHSAKSP